MAVTAIMTPKQSGRAIKADCFRRSRDSFTPEAAKQVALPTWAQQVTLPAASARKSIPPTESILKNGLRVFVHPTTSGKAVTVYGYVKCNSDLQTPAGKDGVSDLLEMLFEYGTAHLNRQAYSSAQDRVGAAIQVGGSFSLGVGAPNGKSTIIVPDKLRVQDEVTLKETLKLTRSNSDYYPLQLGLTVLSGGFYATRLNNELREKRGLVYSVDASLTSDKVGSELEITYGTSAKNVAVVQNIIEHILRDLAVQPVTTAELDQAKNILLNQMILSKTNYEGIAGELLECAVLGLPLDEPATAAEIYSRITAHQVLAAVAKWLRPADFVQVTRGPRPR